MSGEVSRQRIRRLCSPFGVESFTSKGCESKITKGLTLVEYSK